MEGLDETNVENLKPEKMVMTTPFEILRMKQKEYVLRNNIDNLKRDLTYKKDSIFYLISIETDELKKKKFTNDQMRKIESEKRIISDLPIQEIRSEIEIKNKELNFIQNEIELYHSLLRGWQLILRKEGKE